MASEEEPHTEAAQISPKLFKNGLERATIEFRPTFERKSGDCANPFLSFEIGEVLPRPLLPTSGMGLSARSKSPVSDVEANIEAEVVYSSTSSKSDFGLPKESARKSGSSGSLLEKYGSRGQGSRG